MTDGSGLPEEECPNCGSRDWWWGMHGPAHVVECEFKECRDCSHEWDHDCGLDNEE